LDDEARVIAGMPLALDADTVLRHIGNTAGPAGPELRASVEQLRRQAQEMLVPRAVLRLVPVAGVAEGKVNLGGGQSFHSKRLSGLLAGVETLAVMVGTVGEALEEEVTRLFAVGEYVEAMALDAIGSVAVEEVCQYVRSLVCREYADAAGWRVGPSLSPGYQYWDIREQAVLFSLLPADDIGVTLTESSLMLPRKSESAIVPLGRNLKVTAGEDEPPCRFCDRQDCPARLR
jgi:hypothetical protein